MSRAGPGTLGVRGLLLLSLKPALHMAWAAARPTVSQFLYQRGSSLLPFLFPLTSSPTHLSLALSILLSSPFSSLPFPSISPSSSLPPTPKPHGESLNSLAEDTLPSLREQLQSDYNLAGVRVGVVETLF